MERDQSRLREWIVKKRLQGLSVTEICASAQISRDMFSIDRRPVMQGQTNILNDLEARKDPFELIIRICDTQEWNQPLTGLLETLRCYRKSLETETNQRDPTIHDQIANRLAGLDTIYSRIMMAIGTHSHLRYLFGNYTRRSLVDGIQCLVQRTRASINEREKTLKMLNSATSKEWGKQITKYDQPSLLRQWFLLAVI